MNEKKLICTACPRGCALIISVSGDDVSVSGNFCPKGLEYGRQEAVCPLRILTTTVPCADGGRIPVKTSPEIPLADIPRCMKEIRALAPFPKTACGSVLARGLLGGKTDLIAGGTP